MAISSLRTSLTRWGLIVALALTVGVGSIPAGEASAATPRYTCAQALALGEVYFATGQMFFALGDYANAKYYFGKAQVYAEYC